MDLRPGDVLSYSAGSTQTGPDGFRKLVPGRRSMLDALGRLWPELLATLGDRPILFLNAYPATIGTFTPGITVDTYLSQRVFTRAVQLGVVADHPVILLAQPLFVAELLSRHLAGGFPLPERLMVWTGGYAMPGSLERMITALVDPHVSTFSIVQYFGAAEVDAGCLMARERNADGELIYRPRRDVEVAVDGGRLLLTLRSSDGGTSIERFATGDLARADGDGWVIRNPRRLHPDVDAAMASWSDADWRRRTGYVRRDEDTLWMQLREGEIVEHDGELEHYDFGRRFSFSWLVKPHWR
ncbi:MAG: hypothetical protein AAGE94_07950 [Acidobacteriota bacterium]